MGNITGKIDLQKLQGATIMELGKNKTKCIVLPIEMAGLYAGEKGTYLDWTAIPLKEVKADRKDTHFIKLSVSKDKFNAMTEEQKSEIPILGNAIAWPDSGSQKTESKPTSGNSAAPSWL